MRFFFDTEFIEAQPTLDMISIGMVCEDGREFYAVSTEFQEANASQWVRDNVLARLPPRSDPAWMTRSEIATRLRAFIGDSEPEFWAYFADYDWVAFCWLFGSMIDLPKGWPMFCLDLKQTMVERGIRRGDLPPDPTDAHNALADARWLAQAYRLVMRT